MSASWKLTLPCRRDEVDGINDALDLGVFDDPAPTLITREVDTARPDDWVVEAYFETRPDAEVMSRFRALVPSARRIEATVEELPDADWLTLSQAGLQPILEGRFHVHAGPAPADLPAGAIRFRVDAGRAFGTGQHETTAGCLAMIDRLRREGRRYGHVLDLGTGTGLLAFAAARAWPLARVTASDIDPVSIEVAAENAALNDMRLGDAPGQVLLLVADGLAHRQLVRRAPYELIIANILAGPLIDMAPSIAAALAPGGDLILAGLLTTQAEAVVAAYLRVGCRPRGRLERGDWTILRLRGTH